MASKRYGWGKHSWEENAYQLKSISFERTANKDFNVRCLIRSCAKKIKSGERVYWPSANPNSLTNKIGAHVECVDRFCAEHTAQSAKEAKALATKDLLVIAEAKPAKPTKVVAKPTKATAKTPVLDTAASGSALITQLQALREQLKSEGRDEGYQEGYQAGMAAALAVLAGTDPDGKGKLDGSSSH